jgi:hypothetical protein
MMQELGHRCAVCGARDERALVHVLLVGGCTTTLCGTHALMHRRSGQGQRSVSELRASLADRRARDDRRHEGDELGAALAAAFGSEKRGTQRRRA